MPNPKVSIIVPNYNHAKFLTERLESVFDQTFQDFEVILLDDCSIDNSLEVLSSYKDHEKVSHFKVNKKNSGSVFKQWIKGIQLAKGEFIWIAESDDIANINFLNYCIEHFKNEDEHLAVFCPSIEVDEDGSKTGRILGPIQKQTGFKIKGKRLVAENLVRNLVIGNASGVLFRKNAFKYVDFNILANFSNTGDRYTYIQLALNGSIYFLNEELNYYRNHQNNTTKKNNINNKIFFDRAFILEYLIPVFSDDKVARQFLMEFYFKSIFKYIYVLPLKLNQKIIKSFFSNNYYSLCIRNKILVYNFLLVLFKVNKPHFLRVYYKKMINNKLNIQI